VQNKGNRGTAGQKFTFPSKDNFFNLGNGFDWSNQWFLAPYPGTYFFSLSGTKHFAHFSFFGNSNTQRRASILVYLNGKEIGEALSSQKTEYGSFSFQFSRKLEKGAKIELIMHGESAEVYILSFTGWMLEQDLQN